MERQLLMLSAGALMAIGVTAHALPRLVEPSLAALVTSPAAPAWNADLRLLAVREP